jgi:hypothetical protein
MLMQLGLDADSYFLKWIGHIFIIWTVFDDNDDETDDLSWLIKEEKGDG